MTPEDLDALGDELELFLEEMTYGMGRLERRTALQNYLRGLLLDGERKSIEPIAFRLADEGMGEAIRQRLQQAVVVAKWDEGELFRRILIRVGNELPGIEAFVIDDTGVPKKGRHSPGVARQYSGTLGRVDNCQVLTSLHLASENGGACVGMQLYLPKEWTDKPERMAKAGIPDDVVFQTKGQIALSLLDKALAANVGRWPVVADAGFGDSSAFRDAIVARGLKYVVGINKTPTVWGPGSNPKPPSKHDGKPGRPKTKWTGDAKPTSVGELAASLPDSAWKKVTWKTGSRGPQSGYFARVRVQTAHGHSKGKPPGDEVWLLCEKTQRKKQPTTFYLSNTSPSTSMRKLVRLAKIRWRIERDYQEMKSELGLDHFEGRTWRGIHHHVALVAAAHAFLTLRRALSPPGDDVPVVSPCASTRAAANGGALPSLSTTNARQSSA